MYSIIHWNVKQKILKFIFFGDAMLRWYFLKENETNVQWKRLHFIFMYILYGKTNYYTIDRLYIDYYMCCICPLWNKIVLYFYEFINQCTNIQILCYKYYKYYDTII